VFAGVAGPAAAARLRYRGCPPLVARPAGGAVTVSHGVVVRRGCFPAGTGTVLPEGSAGIAHARARFVPGAPPSGACLLDGTLVGVIAGVWGWLAQ